MAGVDQLMPTKPPFLILGKITPEMLYAWKMGCHHLFKHKKISAEEYVGIVV